MHGFIIGVLMAFCLTALAFFTLSLVPNKIWIQTGIQNGYIVYHNKVYLLEQVEEYKTKNRNLVLSYDD